jgi:hypothetical protein
MEAEGLRSVVVELCGDGLGRADERVARTGCTITSRSDRLPAADTLAQVGDDRVAASGEPARDHSVATDDGL